MEYSGLDIIKLRQKLKVSQRKLAEVLSVHLRTIQNWEAGGKIPKTKYEILCRLISDDGNSTSDILTKSGVTMETPDKYIAHLTNKLHEKEDRISRLEFDNNNLREQLAQCMGKQSSVTGPGGSESQKGVG